MPGSDQENIYRKPPIGMGPGGKPYRAMVVDDSKTARTMLRQILLSVNFDAGLDAENGELATILVEKHGKMPDFCFVDLEMPVMNGIETVQKLRPLLPQCVFIMVTSHSEKEHVMKALEQGCAGYIVKPFNRDTVLLQIEKIMGKDR